MSGFTSYALAVAVATPPAAGLVSPGLLFVLSIVGALGMILLLPGGRDTPFGKIGGAILLALLLVLAALLGKMAAGVGIYFWIFSAIALIGAVRVITHTKPVYSALYFVLTVMASAGLFVLMWAEFMAAALVLIYAGAILVTYVFVIMLASEAHEGGAGGTGTEVDLDHDAVSREPILASAAGFALMGILLFVIFDKSGVSQPPASMSAMSASAKVAPATAIAPQPVMEGATQQLGAYLFGNQLINLELAGLILTIAMVGAIIIARRSVWRSGEALREMGETLVAPATPIDDNPHSIPVFGTDNPRQKAYPET
jgi:NADH-quinone oxidoreductase subunit J